MSFCHQLHLPACFYVLPMIVFLQICVLSYGCLDSVRKNASNGKSLLSFGFTVVVLFYVHHSGHCLQVHYVLWSFCLWVWPFVCPAVTRTMPVWEMCRQTFLLCTHLIILVSRTRNFGKMWSAVFARVVK